MNVTVENLAPCKKLLRVEVDTQKVEEAFEAVTRDFQRKAKFPGFRPGKVPLEIVARRFEKEILDKAKEKLINDSYKQALEEQKLDAVGKADVEELQFGRGRPCNSPPRSRPRRSLSCPNIRACRRRSSRAP